MLTYINQREFMLDWARGKVASEIRLLGNDIYTVINGITNDLLILSDLPQLRQYLDLEDKYDKNLSLLEI